MAKNILICDDAAFMRMMIKDILTKNGYNVAGEAENGAKAVEKYAELKPDLVLMDITMPEMDGIEVLHAAQNSPDISLEDTVVIALTANAITGIKQTYLDAGFDDYLSKPINPKEMEDMIAARCNL